MHWIRNVIKSKVLFEFFSVTFAVLLAFTINRWYENASDQRLAKQAIRNIWREVSTNANDVSGILKTHEKGLAYVDSILATQDTTSEAQININFALLASTAWETTKQTQAVTFMDFDLVADISETYTIQYFYEQRIQMRFLDRMNDKFLEMDGHTDKKKVLMEFQMILRTTLAAEQQLLSAYNALKEQLEKYCSKCGTENIKESE